MTYYVKPESLIDREAFSRATSVYLVDRTIPMLPERLCNQICSLRPNEEKLCFSVIFELNKNAEIQQSHITRTIIKSDRRFTYEEAQAVIETGEGEYKEEILPVGVRKIVIEAGISMPWNRIVFNDKYLITLDKFGLSGSREDVYKKFGFDVDSLEEKVENLLK